MLTKMRKRWIHQTMEETTPMPSRVDETSGTEKEHKHIDHGNSTLCPLFVPVLTGYRTWPSRGRYRVQRQDVRGRRSSRSWVE